MSDSTTVNEIIQIGQDSRKIHDHKIDSINLLIYTSLLILVILTIWLFKFKRFPYIHETGLAVFYGGIFGIIIRYGFVGTAKKSASLQLSPSSYNVTDIRDLPEFIHLKIDNYTLLFNYEYKGPLRGESQQDYEEKATFDPEIFFNLLLPPIIFHAGYSMKRRHFFKNFGGILTFAFFGTAISSFFVAGFMYVIVLIFGSLRAYVSFTDCLFFGAIISATDPVTVLAIFNDQKVDVNLYALVFGESVLNDAVSIALAQAVEKYQGNSFDATNLLRSIGNFVVVISGAFGIGSLMGLITALMTKFTHIRQYPHLETALFILMSYSTFLASEAAGLTGIVAVLFCGIVQAHYTYNNLSRASQEHTRELFSLLNFFSENFIFVYIGVSLFTFRYHRWEASFIIFAFIAIVLARALNIYPLSFLINLTRTNKIERNMQHMMFFSGLRGAMAFALAMRNTSTKARQLILTTTSLIVIFTVIGCGGMTSKMLVLLKIRTGAEADMDGRLRITEDEEEANSSSRSRGRFGIRRNLVLNAWRSFDKDYIKPLLTNSRPTLIETAPKFCLPVARFFTTREQLGIDSINGSQSSLINELIPSDEQLIDQNCRSVEYIKDKNLIQMDAVSL